MQAHDGAANDGCQWKMIEDVEDALPHEMVAVLPVYLIVEAIYAG